MGSHGDRRHAGVDGSLNSGFLYFSLPHARPVPVKSGLDGGPRRFTEVVLNEQSVRQDAKALEAGTNKILLKLYQNTQGWEFCVRIVTADGLPVPFKQKSE